MENAFPFLTNAPPTPKTVTASLATKDTTSLKDNASSPNGTMPSLPTPDVPLGTGTTKSALPAPKDGFSMLTKSVLPLPISAEPLTRPPETALLVMKDTTSLKDNVFTLLPTTPDLPTSDVPLGTGKINNA